MPDQLLRVLVVDDNHDNADIVSQYLENTRDYIVSVAYDGDEALRSFGDQRPDLVLLDVMMPGINGWEVCRAMKSDPAHADKTRVIMVTARDDLSDKRTALQTGADDFLEKPLDLSKLLTTVRRNAVTLLARRLESEGAEIPESPGTPATHA
jgi:CheY-like chemotaxis protein